MTPAHIFQLQLALGYLPWLLVLSAYVFPRLKTIDPVKAHQAIAALHSFRFFGLVFIAPGVVGPGLPEGFAASAAYGDFAAGLLAMAALATVRVRPLFWAFVAGFNLVGAADLILNYYHGVRFALPEHAGDLGAAYWIPVLYVPLLMITHGVALWLLLQRRQRSIAPALAARAAS